MPNLVISSFEGDYRFLSNFYPCEIAWDNLEFPSVENAFQARKTSDPDLRWRMTDMTPGAAKRLGQQVTLPANWEEIKFRHMLQLVEQKFTRHERLRRLLLATNRATLVEGNSWGDVYWGRCNGVGENRLGVILMHVRAKLDEGRGALWLRG